MFRPKKTVLHLRMFNFNNHLLDQSCKALSPNPNPIGSGTFRSPVFSLLGASESSRELSFQGANVPSENFSSEERTYE